MKTKLILRTMKLLILMASLTFLNSCSKTETETLTDEQITQDTSMGATLIDSKDLTETDEDLTTVDYKEYYDQLASHGEWIQVKPEDIGLKSKIASSKNSGSNSISLSNLLGVKDANAETDLDFGMMFVWKPSADFAVTAVVGETPEYRPYSNGQWVNSDAGWYFKAPTPWEETVHHHGRWAHTRDAGWLWIPGRVWAPAWVDWRQDDDYISWAPLGPSIYFSAGNMGYSPINDDYYSIVERRHFIDPDIYRYSSPYYEDGSRISMSLMIGTVGLVIENNIIINRGPDINIIQNYYDRDIGIVYIHHTRNYGDVRYSDREYNVYTPDFRRYHEKDNKWGKKNEPKNYNKFEAWKGKKSESNDNRKEDKNTIKNNNANDNWSKYNSQNNGNKNKSQDNGNKNKSQDNGNKNNEKDNGNKKNGK